MAFTAAQIIDFGITQQLLYENLILKQANYLPPLLIAGKTAYGVGATITLPAVTGKTHVITSINISTTANLAVAGLNTIRTITSTNLGGLELLIQTLRQLGVSHHIPNPVSNYGIKATAQNTPTTLILPAIPNLAYVYSISYKLI